MKHLLCLTCLTLALGIIFLPVVVNAQVAQPGSNDINSTQTTPRPTPVKGIVNPSPTPRPGSAEVVYPITHPAQQTTPRPTTVQPTLIRAALETETTRATPTVTIPPTTVTVTRTISQTTPTGTVTTRPVTTTITSTPTTNPVVTVTVLVYSSSPVYLPSYYYPPGYPYPIDYYNPAGSLTVTSNPSGAAVTIDGYNYANTPYIFTGLTTGYHTVEVNYPGYEAYVTNIYVDTGANPEVYADLTSLVNYGTLFVDSTPQGADVYVDGNYEGTTPVTVSSLSEGAHQVELHRVGYEVLQSTENVIAGQGTVTNLVLIPYSSSSNTGSIDISSNMPGALVYLDGIYKGTMHSGSIFNVISVDAGSHTVLLHLPGYTDFTQMIEVNAGQISNVDATFTPAPPQNAATSPAGTGSIVVTSTPSGGQVTVDNQVRGVAPVTIYNVASGSHIVNMKLPGYNDYSTSVDVLAGQVAQVTAVLEKGSTAPAPTPGIALSPFVIIAALALCAVIVSSRIRR